MPASGNLPMTNTRSTKVPKGWEEFYTALAGVTDRFCAEHLNDEYADLARSAIAALCRKRPSPLASGNLQTWGCAVLYALGLKSLCVHIATDDALPVEVPPPPSRRKYWTRKGIAEWLADAEGMTDDETH